MVGTLLWIGILLIIIGIVAYLLGAQGVAGMTAGLGRTLLILGVVLGLILIVINLFTGNTATTTVP